MTSTVACALQMTSLFLYFWSQQKFPLWIAESADGFGFRCYRRVSQGRKVFAREKFRFSPLTADLEPCRTAKTRPSKGKIYLRQISKLGGRCPKRECSLQCASDRVLSDVQQSLALAAYMKLSISRCFRPAANFIPR